MKLSAFFFCLSALVALAEAQNLCTFDNAVLYIVPSGPSGSSNGSPGSSNRTSGSVDASPPSPNESSSNSNESSAADDSSILDPPDAGLTAPAEASAAATQPFSGSIKARALHWGRTLSKRADFTCTEEETCYTVNNGLFCANGRNANFHEPDGTVGNINTGDYTLADGSKGNLYNGPPPEVGGDSTPTASVSETAGDSTPTASASGAAGDPTPASSSEPAAATATTGPDGALISQATGTESRRPTTASPTSNARPTTSSASSSLQPESSVSGASTSSTAVPDSAASGLQLSNYTVATVISIIAGSLLWRTSLF